MEGMQEAKGKRRCIPKHSRGFSVGQREEEQRGGGKAGKRQVGSAGRRAYLKKILANNLSFLYELESKALGRGHDGRCG